MTPTFGIDGFWPGGVRRSVIRSPILDRGKMEVQGGVRIYAQIRTDGRHLATSERIIIVAADKQVNGPQ